MSLKGFSEAELKQMRDTFNFFDKNGDGNITCAELGSVMKTLGQNPTVEQVKAMIKEVDKDGDGTLNFEEFVSMFYQHQTTDEGDEDLREAFNAFDKDGDGFITKKEIELIMAKLNEPLSQEEINAMILAADTDGDGQVSFDEFKELMRKKTANK